MTPQTKVQANHRKKVFVGGLHHESDTFNPITTGRDDIWVIRGDGLLNGNGRNSVFGIIHTLRDSDCEVVPGILARAVPNGEWDKEYYLEFKEEFLSRLKEALPVDGICLALHGSMRVREIGEAEGDILEAIARICPNVPVVSSLDMHATITDRMTANADAFVGYKCAPHTDTYETGIHAARMMLDILNQGAKPKMAAVHLPFMIAGEQSETSVQPMLKLVSALREYEKRPLVMAASYLLGFPWADVPENGVTAMVVVDGDETLAKEYALELAHLFWDTRFEFGFYNETLEVEDAIEEAKKSIAKGACPVVLSDSGDNPTAGSSQDVTNFLKAILEDDSLFRLDPPLCYQGFYDPSYCEKAFEAGVGSVIQEPLGAAFDKRTSSPIVAQAKVKALVKAWSGAQGSDLVLVGLRACPREGFGGERSEVDVVVTSKHVGCYDPEMMRALGVEPSELKAIVVKLGYLEPEIRAIAKRSIMVLTDGSTNEIFERLPFENIVRPIFPMDRDATCSFGFFKQRQ